MRLRIFEFFTAAFVGLATNCAIAADQEIASLRVHLAQANNRSPYALVRAKFEPGEVVDPWAVRFFGDDGAEIPYFVWDSVTWNIAREGRPDWGGQYPLINHYCGNDPGIPQARDRKLEWAHAHVPELGAKLAAHDERSKREGNSVCAALYLLRHPVAPYGKQRITLRTYDRPQVQPRHERSTEKQAAAISVRQGDLTFQDLPDRIRVSWQGRDLFRYAGYDAGQSTGSVSHVDRTKPFIVETMTGIITKLSIQGQTPGRNGGDMHWQCTYWLFPEGAYAALEGFSLSKTAGYVGGSQKLSIWEGDGFKEVHSPLWESPWWLHEAGDRGFVATHLFHSTPLTIGYGNNPFTTNSMAPPIRAATMEQEGNRVGLRWFYALDDQAVARLFAPDLYHRLPHYTTRPEDAKAWFDGNRQAVISGKIEKPPEWMTPEAKQFAEEQLKWLRWQPDADWLYRQYLVGTGAKADAAESALRGLLGAAAGWIDRPFDEEQTAHLLAETARSFSTGAGLKWSREMEIAPYLLNSDPAGVKQALSRWPDQVAVTDKYIDLMNINREAGGDYLQGRAGKEGGPKGEGWIVNPSYHATQLPYYVRFLKHFDLPHSEEAYRQAIVRFADYSLELLGGNSLDFDRLRKSYVSHWPSRFVAIVPLMLAANEIKPDQRYTRAATIMFDVLMNQVERNPHGYWTPWVSEPKNWEPFDTVYNAAGVERGLPAFWADGKLDLIGRERAHNFTAAQARYFVFSGQLLDTLEAENVTAIYASKHGGHPSQRKQIPLFLYDDFEFYRGLVGSLIEWSAATPSYPAAHDNPAGGAADRELGMLESGCYLFRWAMGIGGESKPGGKSSAASKWFEYRLEPTADKTGFRVRLWNRLPWTQSTLSVGTRDVGIALTGPKGSIQRPLLWLRFDEPAYREPLVVDVAKAADDRLTVEVNRNVRLRLFYGSLLSTAEVDSPPVLSIRRANGELEAVTNSEGREVVWGEGLVEWPARRGTYQLQLPKR